MKFSISCLQHYIHLNVDHEQIAQTLTDIGFPTEIVNKKPKHLDELKIAKIVNIKDFVNGLRLLTVEYFDTTLQSIEVVCGDETLQVNDCAGLILIGQTVPGTGKKLKSREIHGIVSPGMLCSGFELGINNDSGEVYRISAANTTSFYNQCTSSTDFQATTNETESLHSTSTANETESQHSTSTTNETASQHCTSTANETTSQHSTSTTNETASQHCTSTANTDTTSNISNINNMHSTSPQYTYIISHTTPAIFDAIYPSGYIFDCEVTYNRGDLLSVSGIAKELSAAGLGTLKSHGIHSKISETVNTHVDSINVNSNTHTMSNVSTSSNHSQVNDSIPNINMQTELGICFKHYTLPEHFTHTAHILQYINQQTQVDIINLANHVTHLTGQPMHVYDANTIYGQITIRNSKHGETIEALDGKTYTLPEGIIIACDEKDIISVIGVIGSKRTACTSQTKRILLEMPQLSVEYMSIVMQKLNLNTKSMQLFLHNVDKNSYLHAINQFEIMLKTAINQPGNIQSCSTTAKQTSLYLHNTMNQSEQQEIILDLALAQKISGNIWNQQECIEILQKLGFQTTLHDNQLSCIVPSFRQDIDCPQVLITEYLRMKGYNHIQQHATPLSHSVTNNELSLCQKIRHYLGIYMHEVVTLKAVDQESVNQISELKLSNPMSGVHCVRRYVMPCVLEKYISQTNRSREISGMFEINHGFDLDMTNGKSKNTTNSKDNTSLKTHVNLNDINNIQNTAQSHDEMNTVDTTYNIVQTLYLACVHKSHSMQKIQSILQQTLVAAKIDLQHIHYIRDELNNTYKHYLKQDEYTHVYWKKQCIGIIGAVLDSTQSGANDNSLRACKNLYAFELNLTLILDKCSKFTNQTYINYQHVYTKDFSIKLTAEQTTNELIKKANTLHAPANSKVTWYIFDIYPQSKTIERNIGLRAQIYTNEIISNEDMLSWYQSTLDQLQMR